MAPFWRENQLIQTQKQKAKKGELMIGKIKMQLGSEVGSSPRIQFASHKSKLVARNFDLRSTPSNVGLSLAFHKMSKLI
jgi:hypothetical protein